MLNHEVWPRRAGHDSPIITDSGTPQKSARSMATAVSISSLWTVVGSASTLINSMLSQEAN